MKINLLCLPNLSWSKPLPCWVIFLVWHAWNFCLQVIYFSSSEIVASVPTAVKTLHLLKRNPYISSFNFYINFPFFRSANYKLHITSSNNIHLFNGSNSRVFRSEKEAAKPKKEVDWHWVASNQTRLGRVDKSGAGAARKVETSRPDRGRNTRPRENDQKSLTIDSHNNALAGVSLL